MGQTLLVWAFPFYLIALEMLFRGVSGLDVSKFIGPAIATAGLSSLLPMTKPKENLDKISLEIRKVVESNGGRIVNNKDQKLLPFVWLSILFGFLIWFWASYISEKSPNSTFWFMPKHFAIGLINYLTAAVIAILKERA